MTQADAMLNEQTLRIAMLGRKLDELVRERNEVELYKALVQVQRAAGTALGLLAKDAE